jgi:hypothetical protein
MHIIKKEMTMSENTSKDDIELQQERPNDQDKKTLMGWQNSPTKKLPRIKCNLGGQVTTKRG